LFPTAPKALKLALFGAVGEKIRKAKLAFKGAKKAADD
jgi:hypothetical protein